MFPIDPRYWMNDSLVSPFEDDQNVDVQDPDLPNPGGNIVVWEYEVPKGKAMLIKGWCPYARQRINTVEPTETMQLLPSSSFSGFGVFALRRTKGNAPYLPRVQSVLPTTAAAPSNQASQRGSGTQWVSDEPRKDAFLMGANPWFSLLVESETTAQIVFQLSPAALANPLPNRFTINPANPDKRVDFLGAVVVGVEVSSSHYGNVLKALSSDPTTV